MLNNNAYFQNLLKTVSFLMLMLFSSLSLASDKEDIAKILEQTETPDGIVFEVIGSDAEYLTDALERIQNYKKQLQEKFPELDIAVVSHGSEQFALTSDNAEKYKKAHTKVKRLVASDVPVYICETHAGWRDVAAEDFPKYISIAAQGPAQIRQYQELGYTLVVMD